jgi:CRISPR system Cascade subunit CasB
MVDEIVAMGADDRVHIDDERNERDIVFRWWKESIGDRSAPAGPRAELRRARTIEEVVFVPLFHDLRRRLAATGWRMTDRLALVAGVLAHVREHDGASVFPSQVAASAEGSRNRPRVAPSRFRRILRLGDEDRDELFLQIRRVVALLDGRGNVSDLAESLYWWNERTRKGWALKYYDHVDERAMSKE